MTMPTTTGPTATGSASTGPTSTESATGSEITATVTGIAAAELGVSAAGLAPGADLRAIGGEDPGCVFRVVARVEREYDVELSDEDAFSLTTIAGTVAAVRAALAEQAVAALALSHDAKESTECDVNPFVS